MVLNMLNEEEYDLLKNSFTESQRLFDKLNRVGNQYEEIEHDESGYSMDDEEVLDRHWLKLSSKIVDELGTSLNTHSIELLKNSRLDIRELTLTLKNEEETSKVVVDYSEDGAISITQIS